MPQSLEYKGVERIKGPLVIIEGPEDVGYQELVEVRSPGGKSRTGQVLKTTEDYVIVQVFKGTQGLSKRESRLRFLGEPFKLTVTEDMLGRVFSGIANPLDGGPKPYADEERDINGAAINPVRRAYPKNYIQTGVRAIDCLNTLVRGQKLPIFTGSGLPHNELVTQIVTQAQIEDEETQLAIVFAAMGIKHDEARFFRKKFSEMGSLNNVTMFLNLATDPAEERIITPRCALTLAEYLAFDCDMHVLVILTDMTNYCGALREIGAAREEVPSRKGYPGYLYSDLASLYERTGRIKEKSGSITQMPIVSMPNMDITHPVPDLTGYITEGQLVLSRDLEQKGIKPPINILPSLSRLMKDGIGEGLTRTDHPNVASQLYALYSQVKEVRSIASIIGEEELSEIDKKYLDFGERFENEFLDQGFETGYSIEETLEKSWELISLLPKSELQRVSVEEIEEHYKE